MGTQYSSWVELSWEKHFPLRKKERKNSISVKDLDISFLSVCLYVNHAISYFLSILAFIFINQSYRNGKIDQNCMEDLGIHCSLSWILIALIWVKFALEVCEKHNPFVSFFKNSLMFITLLLHQFILKLKLKVIILLLEKPGDSMKFIMNNTNLDLRSFDKY